MKAKIRVDSFWGDLANALVLSPVHREPVRNDRPKCDSDIHKIPVQSTVSGWFRNYYQTNPETVRTNYCTRCADAGAQLGMFHADNG